MWVEIRYTDEPDRKTGIAVVIGKFLDAARKYVGAGMESYVYADRLGNFDHLFFLPYRLVGLMVRRPPPERKIPGSNPACAGIFLGSSHTSDLKIGIPVATLPGAWRYRVSTGTGRPGVSIL